MIAFKKRSAATKLCNLANSLPGVKLMVLAVPAGWVVTKAKGINNV